MKQIEKIKVRLLKAEEPSFFHDSRQDVRTISKAVNMVIDKVNELIEENKRLREALSNPS